MGNVWTLTKIFLKGTFGFNNNNGKKKNSTFFSYLIFGILLLFIFYSYFLQSYRSALVIGKEGINYVGQSLIFSNTLFLFVLSLTTNISILYLSKDNSQLLHLPIRPREIFYARNIVALVTLYLLEVVFYLAAAVGYAVGIGAGFLYYLGIFLVFLLLPIVPVMLGSIIILLIGKFIKIKNRDIVTYITTLVGAAAGVFFALTFENIAPLNVDPSNVDKIISNGQKMVEYLKFLPLTYPIAQFVNIKNPFTSNLIYFDIEIGITALFILLCGFLADKMYLKNLLNLEENNGRKRKYDEQLYKKSLKNRTVVTSLLDKEKKTIFRNPVFVILSILPIITPVVLLIVIISLTHSLNYGDLEIVRFYSKNYYLIGAIAIAYLCVMVEYGSVTMFSKDGTSATSMSYMPISFIKIYLSKVFFCFLVNVIPYLVCTIYAGLFLKISLSDFIFPFTCGLLFILAVSFIGVLMDLSKPNLKWNSENEITRNNMKIFKFIMLKFVLALVAVILGAYAPILFLLIIGLSIVMIYRNESEYIDRLS